MKGGRGWKEGEDEGERGRGRERERGRGKEGGRAIMLRRVHFHNAHVQRRDREGLRGREGERGRESERERDSRRMCVRGVHTCVYV